MNTPHDFESSTEKDDFQVKSGKKIDWKKIAILALVIGIAGYTWYTENFGGEGGGAAVAERESDKKFSQDDYAVNFDPASSRTDSRDSSAKSDSDHRSTGSKSTKPYLQPAGGRNLKSPAGLIYTGGREHRTDHVLRHAKDIPDRSGPHGVFHADGDDVFRLIDEAYELVKQKSKQVKVRPQDGGKTEYVIDMKREIGFKGGQTGARQRHPKLYKIKLILGDNRVITAYPY